MSDFSDQSNTLDSGQAIKAAYDKEAVAHRVIALNSLVPEKFDTIDISYIVAGNGKNQIGLLNYKLGITTVAVLCLSYDAFGGSEASSNRLISVIRI